MLRLLLTTILYCLAIPLQAQPYQITDSFGKHFFEQPPQRVVVTDWALLDNLLELGVIPVGAPELEQFQAQFKHPAFSQDITDIGLRHAPALDVVEALKPDVIIIGTGQKELARPFSRIAKVVYYKNFSERYRNHGEKSRERFLQLAELFQREALAGDKLTAQDKQLAQFRAQLRRSYSQGNTSELPSELTSELPAVTLATVINSRTLLIYGQSSMPGYALQQLGLPVSTEAWGEGSQLESKLAVSALNEKNCQHFMLFETVYPLTAWYQSSPWQALSTAVQQCVRVVNDARPIWPYGGAMSIGRIAEAVTEQLLAN